MQDLRTVIAANISTLRRENGFTQLSFAERLNYSDKAVSKWERGESVPDIVVLKEIADLFGVTVDYLLKEEHEKTDEIPKKHIVRNRRLITFGSFVCVWLIATVIFVNLDFFAGRDVFDNWRVFVYALPVSDIVLLVFNCIWGNRKLNSLIVSVLMWSVLLVLYTIFIKFNPWLIFIVGIPAEVVILLFSGIQKK